MNSYRILKNQVFVSGAYSLVPIRFQDRYDIMKWRNEQIYHLRQSKPLTEADQDKYFSTVINELFTQEKPEQILFSFLKNDKCIGYGGLVHIDWIDMNAEISFIMETKLEKVEFHKNWSIYLDLVESIAFDELSFHKIYSYAFDLRPHLYETIESKGFLKEAVLKEHCLFQNEYIDVIIHSKLNERLSLRKITQNDKEITYQWANDELTRANSFNSSPISFDEHSLWFDKKIVDSNSFYFICEINNSPAGLIRFDLEGDRVITGITIDKKFRGKKLSSRILRYACEKLLKNMDIPIIAYIKINNIASIKSFEKAGFIFVEKIIIKNMEANEYIYKR